jgi:aminoglycoside/choline kinase family phosphotransferase
MMAIEGMPLFEELVRHRFGAATGVARIAVLAGDASTRRYARLWLRGSGAPRTVIAMVLADRGVAMSSDELASLTQAPAELPYVNVHRFLAALGVAIPELYVDAAERGVLLLEDIGDTTLWEAVREAPREVVLRLYRQAIDQLLLLQIEGSRRNDPRCIAFQQAFDERLYLWEFEHFIEYGVEKRLTQPLPGHDAAVLRTHFTAIARRLDSQARVLNHRDFHSWNLFVQNGRIRVIDFQDALLATPPYDLATLLGDRDTPEVVRPDVEAELLDDYRCGWEARAGAALPAETCSEIYFLCALQKALKVVGRFYYLDIVKGKAGYLRYIPPTVRQIRRILPRFPEHAEMARVLEMYLP